ncbi:MAG: 3-oxoacyl-ACP reductase family protein [Pseudomonadota bacterium]
MAELSEGRTALVTGGSRGIGRAICIRLAQEGARVAVNYVGDLAAADETKRLVEAEGVACVTVQADVADPNSVQAMVQQTERELGPIDFLVTSAGIYDGKLHNELDVETWRRIMAVNVDGTFLPVMAVKDGMIERGFGGIVCISSIGGLRARGHQLAYSTSKAAVVAFGRSCAEAFAPHVRVNTIAPGLTETEMAQLIPPEARRQLIDATPLRRLGRPEEIGDLAVFLLSERASFITGQTVVADGGRVTLP